SPRSEHHLWWPALQSLALPSRHWPGGRRNSISAWGVPHQSHYAADLFEERSASAAARAKRDVQDDEWRKELGEDIGRPHPSRSGNAAEHGSLRCLRFAERKTSWRDLQHCSIALGCERHLGRNGRWSYSCDARRRQELAERHASRSHGLE